MAGKHHRKNKKKQYMSRKPKPLSEKDFAILMGMKQPRYYKSRGVWRQK